MSKGPSGAWHSVWHVVKQGWHWQCSHPKQPVAKIFNNWSGECRDSSEGCGYSHHSFWLVDTMLFWLLNILYIIPGIDHPINTNSDDYDCLSHKKGNQEFIGQCVLHYLFLCIVCCIPKSLIPTSSLLPGGNSITIANSIHVSSITWGKMFRVHYRVADEKNPSLP